MRLIVVVSMVLVGLCSVAAKGEDWTTTDGKTYKNVTVISHDALTVTILDKDGGASIPISTLPPALQKKFGYDPQLAKELIAKQAEQKATIAGAKQADAALDASLYSQWNADIEAADTPRQAKLDARPSPWSKR